MPKAPVETKVRDKHPYISGPGGLRKTLEQFRKSLPAQINAETLKRLGIAPNNESYIINIIRFLKIIDHDGKKTAAATTTFAKHSDDEFAAAFGSLVKTAYSELFALHADDAWNLETDKLISFFRSADETSAIVGERQAAVFKVLAEYSGHKSERSKEVRTPSSRAVKSTKTSSKSGERKEKKQKNEPGTTTNVDAEARDVGLTVRIEINLPAGADQETYDHIFRSIRSNLLNGN